MQLYQQQLSNSFNISGSSVKMEAGQTPKILNMTPSNISNLSSINTSLSGGQSLDVNYLKNTL